MAGREGCVAVNSGRFLQVVKGRLWQGLKTAPLRALIARLMASLAAGEDVAPGRLLAVAKLELK